MRGDRIRELREKAGLSQEELAQKLAIGESQVWRYEHDESEPRANVVAKLAEFFNVSSDYLLGLSDHPGVYLGSDFSAKELAIISAVRRGEKLKAIEIITAAHPV